jgi:hypothetical protein
MVFEAMFTFTVRNVGQSSARNIALEAQHPHNDRPSLGLTVGEVPLDGALAPDERKRASLTVPILPARNHELVLVAYWEDDGGTHQLDLGWLHLSEPLVG